jgi:hypothetical protein
MQPALRQVHTHLLCELHACCGLSVFILHPPPVYLSPRALELGQRSMLRLQLCACGARNEAHAAERINDCIVCSFGRIAALHYAAIISHLILSRQLLVCAVLSLLSHFWKTNPLWHSKALSFVRKFSYADSEKSATNIIFAFQN